MGTGACFDLVEVEGAETILSVRLGTTWLSDVLVRSIVSSEVECALVGIVQSVTFGSAKCSVVNWSDVSSCCKHITIINHYFGHNVRMVL